MDILNNKKDNWWRPALGLFGQIIGWIVVPIIIALFLGDWMDSKYNTENRYLLIFVIIAFVITNIGLVKVSFDAIKQIDKESKNKNKYEKRG